MVIYGFGDWMDFAMESTRGVKQASSTLDCSASEPNSHWEVKQDSFGVQSQPACPSTFPGGTCRTPEIQDLWRLQYSQQNCLHLTLT